jgi:chromosome segregation ATPase
MNKDYIERRINEFNREVQELIQQRENLQHQENQARKLCDDSRDQKNHCQGAIDLYVKLIEELQEELKKED